MKNKLIINNKEYTRDPIDFDDIEHNDIFCFGSNTLGEHAGGAAAFANRKLGAKMGVGEGMASDQTYAFPTLIFGKTRTDGEGSGISKVSENDFFKSFLLLKHTMLRLHTKKFYITKLGLGIAGWELPVVHKLFWDSGIPFECGNAIYPVEFELPDDAFAS